MAVIVRCGFFCLAIHESKDIAYSFLQIVFEMM